MSSRRRRRDHRRILDQLDGFLELARDPAALELRSERVSSWGVAQHLEHLVLGDRGILKILEQAEPPAELSGQGPSLGGRVLLTLGFIPPGRAKAPSFVDPRELRPEEIEPRLDRTRRRFVDLGPRSLDGGSALARHHRFGCLDGGQWLRFVGIHHHHHGKIIRDIGRASRSRSR